MTPLSSICVCYQRLSAHKTRYEKSIKSLILILPMKKSKFTESQITKALKEYESGRSGDDICRDRGVKLPTFYVCSLIHCWVF
jgi:hypothetical protein